MNAAPQCIGDGAQTEMKTCAYCRSHFKPPRSWSAFCSDRCRNNYEADIGASGKVASVRKIRRGVSIVIHLEGPAAARALNLAPGEIVRLVKKP